MAEHTVVDGVDGKACSLCGKWYPLEVYHRHSEGRKRGYCPDCKATKNSQTNPRRRKGGKYSSSAATAGKMYRARKRAAEGTHTVEETKILRVIYGAQCGACKERRATDVDHVVPLAGGKRHDWGGSDGVGNLQWLCGPCNTEKSDKNANDYRPDGGACARALEALKLYEVRSSAKREMYAMWLIRKLRNQLLPVKLAILEQAKPAKEWLDATEVSTVQS